MEKSGSSMWKTIVTCMERMHFYACNKMYPRYIHIALYVYKLLACLTHRSRQKWWPRNVVVTSSMYKGCSISSLLSNRLQLIMKSLDPHYWNYILHFAPNTCTHTTIARFQRAQSG